MCSHVTRAVLCLTREVSPLTQVQQSQQDHFIHCFKVSSKKAHGLSAPVTVRPHPFLARGSGDGHKYPELALRGLQQARVLGRSVVSDALRPHGLQPARLLCPGDSPGKDTGVGCQALLQGLPHPGMEPRSPALQADSLPSEPPGMPSRALPTRTPEAQHEAAARVLSNSPFRYVKLLPVC